MMTSVSVILPCFNAAATIARAIESVMSQDNPDFELLIVDDASTDQTAQIVRGFTSDPRIKFIQPSERGGANVARNIAIKNSSHDIICFIDSDDRYEPNKLSWVSNFFQSNPKIDVLIDSFFLEHPKPNRSGYRLAPDLTNSQAVFDGIVMRNINKPTPSMTIRRHTLLKAGLFDESMNRRQDLDLLFRLASINARFASTSTVLWRKSWMPSSITANSTSFLPALLELCEKHPQYILNPIFRQGLGTDLLRHTWRKTKARGMISAIQDLLAFAARHGKVNTCKLLGLGIYAGVAGMLPNRKP